MIKPSNQQIGEFSIQIEDEDWFFARGVLLSYLATALWVSKIQPLYCEKTSDISSLVQILESINVSEYYKILRVTQFSSTIVL